MSEMAPVYVPAAREATPPMCMKLTTWASGKIWICVAEEGHGEHLHYFQRLN